MIDFAKIFGKTIAILKRDGLWPDSETVAPVDYAVAQNYKITAMPIEWDVTFSVDFGGSEGIYIDITLQLLQNNDEKTIHKSVGTIKTLTADRETLAAYAALGANFVYFCRQEFQSALYNAFTNHHVYYEVYSLHTVDHFHPAAAEPRQVLENLKAYIDGYALIDVGDFPVDMRIFSKTLCTYLLQRSRVEVGGYYSIEIADIIVCTFSYDGNDKNCAYICIDDNPKEPIFEPCEFVQWKGGV